MNRSYFAAGLFAAFTSAACYGQTAVAKATIPFDFHVGQTTMPAGSYTVSESDSLLVVRGAAGKPTAMLLTLPTSRPGKSSDPSLQFARYGNDYYLAKIWSAESRDGRALPKCRQEQELARRGGFKKTEEVAMRTANHPERDGR